MAAAMQEARRHALLHGPVLPTLLRLALPTITVILAQTVVAVMETYWVSSLGTAALAGVALVFPVLTLMATMSNGGIGGGVSSAVARAMGAGRRDDADALVWHALVLGVAFGGVFMGLAIVAGPALYAALGGEGPVLASALLYSDWVFAGSIPLWAVNLLAAALRGAGEVRLPAVVTLVGAAVLVPLSPALIFGVDPLPALGVAGAGVAVSIYYTGALIVLLRHLMRGTGVLTLRAGPVMRRQVGAILRVGLVSAAGTALASLTLVAVTGAVGLAGSAALAGYGVASRLDFLLIPLLFGLGTAVVTMVGTATGAGQPGRAAEVAWTAAALAVGVTELIGLTVAIAPGLWLRLFTDDPAVLDVGRQYLHRVAPLYGAVGLGMILYFACQGRGRMAWPFAAVVARLLISAGIGWVAMQQGAGLGTLFTVVAIGSAAYGALNAVGMVRAGLIGPASAKPPPG